MYPEICKIGLFTVYSYGLMLAVAFIISSTLLIKQAKKQNMNPDTIFNLAFLVFISGIIGARLFYIIENIDYYKEDPLQIIMLQHGGLSWFGGLVLGVLASVLYLRFKRLPIYKVLDLISPFAALAQSIGRVGCLLNGCCFGKVSEFGIYFPVHNKVLIPVQVYSSLILVFIYIILRTVQDKPHKAGHVFYLYLLLYSTKRFFIEFWRADNPTVFLDLTLFQLLSIAVFLFSFIKLISIIRSK